MSDSPNLPSKLIDVALAVMLFLAPVMWYLAAINGPAVRAPEDDGWHSVADELTDAPPADDPPTDYSPADDAPTDNLPTDTPPTDDSPYDAPTSDG